MDLSKMHLNNHLYKIRQLIGAELGSEIGFLALAFPARWGYCVRGEGHLAY